MTDEMGANDGIDETYGKIRFHRWDLYNRCDQYKSMGFYFIDLINEIYITDKDGDWCVKWILPMRST